MKEYGGAAAVTGFTAHADVTALAPLPLQRRIVDFRHVSWVWQTNRVKKRVIQRQGSNV